MYEAKQRKEKVSRTISPLERKNTEQTHKGGTKILRNVMQRKAGINSFHVRFNPMPENNGEHASFLITSEADFKNDDGYNANDAEFRQDVATKEILKDCDGNIILDIGEGWHDDNYNRAADASMYSGSKLIATDVPGYDQDNPISAGDVVDFTFQSEQKIVDTSDNNKIIATTGKHIAQITGEYQRNFKLPNIFWTFVTKPTDLAWDANSFFDTNFYFPGQDE